MKLLPPTIANIANSKKAVTFWAVMGLWMAQDTIGLTTHALQWLTIAFCAYAIGQGLADIGKGRAEVETS